MNLDLIDQLASSYWDWQLPLFLRFGFPMDFRGNHLDLRNDGSWMKYNMGPFWVLLGKPFGDITHIAPVITRPKPDSDKRRVIVLSVSPTHL